jgi:hypothetical protein
MFNALSSLPELHLYGGAFGRVNPTIDGAPKVFLVT